MTLVLMSCCMAILGGASARADIPDGYEVVDILSVPDQLARMPRINNCGEIVFSVGVQGDSWAEIYRADNGALFQITDDDISDTLPDINDHGTITYWTNADGFGGGEVMMLRDGEVSLVGTGSSSSINNSGHVAWMWFHLETCASESDIFLFDGTDTVQLTTDGLSNQSVRLNDIGQAVWTRYFDCASPWTSEIVFYAEGEQISLPSGTSFPQSPAINNRGDVAWGAFDFLELWRTGATMFLIDGHNPSLNDDGDIAFSRMANGSLWQIWLHTDGEFRQISDDPAHHNGRADINDDREIVWRWMPNGALSPSGVRYLRRIRTGEADFDGDVDGDDYKVMQGCVTGPFDTDRLCDCRFLDIDHNRSVDLADFAIFQNAYTGP